MTHQALLRGILAGQAAVPGGAPPEPVTQEYRVATDVDGGTLYVPLNYWGGPDGEPFYWQTTSGNVMRSNLRFTNLLIPPGSTITAATLTVWSRGSYAANASKWNDVGAEQADNPGVITNAANFAARATNVGTVVRWPYPTTTHNLPFTSPDLSAVVQQIIDRGGWASGNAIQFFTVTDTNTPATGWPSDPQAESVTSAGANTGYRARLDVTFTPPA